MFENRSKRQKDIEDPIEMHKPYYFVETNCNLACFVTDMSNLFQFQQFQETYMINVRRIQIVESRVRCQYSLFPYSFRDTLYPHPT